MVKNLTLKGTKICDCGREFDIHDIKRLERIDDNSFYAGVVKHYSRTICPHCGKEVILLLKQVGQTYEIVNVAEENFNIRVENKSIDINIQEENTSNAEITTTIDIDKKDISSNEFICQECGKVLKSKSGLTNHLKTHQK